MALIKLSVAIFLMTSIIARVESTGTTIEESDIVNSNETAGFEGHAHNTFGHGNVGRCEVLYGGKCYILIMSMARMGLSEAQTACKGAKGRLANIYSEEHFHLIRALIRSRIPIKFHYNHVWLGLQLDVATRRVKLSNGQWAPFTIWYPNRPFASPRPYMGMHVDFDSKSDRQGYFDEWSSHKLLGGVCEIQK